ncbi:uncharacterized protein EV154DRAFT_476361 [Mucor mucedo]|uniref:uncharacterized protein n=1 Tax=Mucor mucedo TaxID=29922 RepID=UPI00222119BB|nr:uncharacterized protein EV154DRAFT_476361 [Mucor mucedo]KAI7896724.1 hypothetical protein EV154DRAFT_476361 [Mucor mucedo]
MTLNIILIPGRRNLLAVYGHLYTFYIRRSNFNVLAKFQLNTKIKNEFVNSTYMEMFCVPIYITQQRRTNIGNVFNISGNELNHFYPVHEEQITEIANYKALVIAKFGNNSITYGFYNSYCV